MAIIPPRNKGRHFQFIRQTYFSIYFSNITDGSISTKVFNWYSCFETEDGMTKEEAALQKCCRGECVVILQLPCNLLCAVMFYKNCSDRWSTHYKIMVQEEATLKKYQIKVTTFITSWNSIFYCIFGIQHMIENNTFIVI